MWILKRDEPYAYYSNGQSYCSHINNAKVFQNLKELFIFLKHNSTLLQDKNLHPIKVFVSQVTQITEDNSIC